MSNSLFNNNIFKSNNGNNNSEKGIFSSNFQNIFNNNKNKTLFNNNNSFFQKSNQLINNNQNNSQNNNNSFTFNLKENDLNKNIFGNNISTNFSIFNKNNKNDNSYNSIFQPNNILNNQNSIFSSKNEYENTINWVYKSKEINEINKGKNEKSLLISFTVDNFKKGSFEEYRLADIEYKKTKKNELYKVVDRTNYGLTFNDSYNNSKSIFGKNIFLNNETSNFKDDIDINEFENDKQIIINQSNNLMNKNNAFINPPQQNNTQMFNQNNNSFKTFNYNNNIFNTQNNNNSNLNSFLPNNNNNNFNSNNIAPKFFDSNTNNNKSTNNNPINNTQNICNNNHPLFNHNSLNYISTQEINKNDSLNNQNYLNNSFDIPFQIISFQDNECLNISESVENAILKRKDINCFIQEMYEKYSNKDKDNYYFGKYLQKKCHNNINTSYIKKPIKNIEYYHKKYSNLYNNTTKKRYLNNKNNLLSRSNSLNSSFSQLSKNEIENKYLTTTKKSNNENYNFTNYRVLNQKHKNSNKENQNNNNLIFKQENKKRNIISFKVKINLPNDEKCIINLDEINIINKVIVLKNQIQAKLQNIINENFSEQKIENISILIPGTFLIDDKQLNSYNLTENIEAIIIYKEKENGGILIKKKKIAPIELIPKLSKNGYYTFPEYINLCRMSEDELRNIENFKIYNENGEIQFLEKINLLGANLDNEYIIEKNEIEIKKNLNVKKKCILYNLKFENYDENILKQFRERITEKNGEFVSYEPQNGRLEWYYVN